MRQDDETDDVVTDLPDFHETQMPDERVAVRGKRQLFMLLTLGMLALLVLVWSAPGALRSGWNHLFAIQRLGTVPTATPPPDQLGHGTWERLSLPEVDGTIDDIAVSPSRAETIYLCAGPLYPNGGEALLVSLQVTYDAGQTWRTIIPPMAGRACKVQIASDDAQRVLFTIYPIENGPACQGFRLFISNDGGRSWKESAYDPALAALASADWCYGLITAHHLYSIIAYEDTNTKEQVSRLQRSDDDGQTWEWADLDLGTGVYFFPMQARNEDTMIASDPRTLWATTDAGHHWRRLGPTPGNISLDALEGFAGEMPDSGHPIYAMKGDIAGYVRVFQTLDGQHWTALPHLPAPSRVDLTYFTNIQRVLGVLGDGRLVALGGDPKATVTPTPAENEMSDERNEWIWLWNPRTEEWGWIDAPLTSRFFGCGVCLGRFITEPNDSSHTAYFWVVERSQPFFQLFRLKFEEGSGSGVIAQPLPQS